MKFNRFISENKPPYTFAHRRYEFGVKTKIKGKQYGIVGTADKPPDEVEWLWAEEELGSYANAQ